MPNVEKAAGFMTRLRLSITRTLPLAAAVALFAATPPCARAQELQTEAPQEAPSTPQPSAPQAPAPPSAPTTQSPDAAPAPTLTMFPHSETAPWYIAGQANFVEQLHARFPAKYSGTNSLLPDAQTANSRLGTVFLGYSLTRNLEFFLDVEDASGHGLSRTLGLANFPDLDAVRANGTSSAPYFARMMMRWVIPFSTKLAPATRNFLGLAAALPERRLEVRLGKFSMPDFFDINAVGSDSHLQLLGWGMDNNAAYDYAADTHGYTYGLLVEYHQPNLVLRY